MDTIVPILLLVALVPGAHGQSQWEGRKSCWSGEYTFKRCCDTSKGSTGDKGCWYGNAQYDT